MNRHPKNNLQYKPMILKQELLCLIAVVGFSCQRVVERPHVITEQKRQEWKAGVASVVITPEQTMWMAGYAARTKHSEGKIHDLHAKTLALEDFQGTRLVIVTVDLIGIPRSMRDQPQYLRVVDQPEEKPHHFQLVGLWERQPIGCFSATP